MMSCQVSLYPLGNRDYEKIVLEAVRSLPQEGIEVDVNPMSTILRGDDEKVWEAVKSLYQTGKSFGYMVMTMTLSNRCGIQCKKDAESKG